MKVIFAQSANANHFTSFGLLPEGGLVLYRPGAHACPPVAVPAGSQVEWLEEKDFQGKPCFHQHSSSTGKHHHRGFRKPQRNYSEALEKTEAQLCPRGPESHIPTTGFPRTAPPHRSPWDRDPICGDTCLSP